MRAPEANLSGRPEAGSLECGLFARSHGEAAGRWPVQTVLLPGGFVDAEGLPHREVELAPLTGFDEEFLAGVDSAGGCASLVTALLTRCVKRVGRLERVTTSLVRDLLVGDRDFLMLKLRETTFGKKLDAVLYCGDSNCGKPMDVTLNIDDFAPEAKPVASRFFALDLPVPESRSDKFSVEFRLPTGADQEATALSVANGEEPVIDPLFARMIARVNEETRVDQDLVGSLPAALKLAIEAEMEKLAPQLTIELEIVCVECKKTFSTLLDLSSFFLAEIKQGLRSLDREVHFLAWHYHWPESDILGLTRRKRRGYIGLIQEETLGASSAEAHRIGAA